MARRTAITAPTIIPPISPDLALPLNGAGDASLGGGLPLGEVAASQSGALRVSSGVSQDGSRWSRED